MPNKNPPLEVYILAGKIWQTNKELMYSGHSKKRQREVVNRMEKEIEELKTLIPLLDQEVKMLRELHRL